MELVAATRSENSLICIESGSPFSRSSRLKSASANMSKQMGLMPLITADSARLLTLAPASITGPLRFEFSILSIVTTQNCFITGRFCSFPELNTSTKVAMLPPLGS
jgi:hypothetical protein